jgi:hypothetical protein
VDDDVLAVYWPHIRLCIETPLELTGSSLAAFCRGITPKWSKKQVA